MILTPENYFSPEADYEYMSNSQYKGFRECETRQLAIVTGQYKRPDTKTFNVGHYIHAWNDNDKRELFIDENYDHLKSLGLILKTGHGKKSSELRAVDEIIFNHGNDPVMKAALAGEKEVINTFELFGIQWKSMIDTLNIERGYFTDLKFLKDLKKRKLTKK